MGAFGAWECPICREVYQDGDDHKCAAEDLIARVRELEAENEKLWRCVELADVIEETSPNTALFRLNDYRDAREKVKR